MAKRLKIVQIGIGGWGWSWIGVAQQSTAWELQAIVDVNAEALHLPYSDILNFVRSRTPIFHTSWRSADTTSTNGGCA